MKRDLQRLANEWFDLVVIGGGVYGLAAARDAALRGYSVALLEKADFGAATSAGSLKLVHGGLRYLQHLNFRRMRISINERRRLLKAAPHLVHPLPFMIPCYGHAIKGPEALRLAFWINDLMSFDRNRGLPPDHRIPAGRLVPASECLSALPGIRAERLTGAGIFYDAQMYSSERLTLAFGLSAARAGAALANYAEVVGFKLRNDLIEAAIVRDTLSGDRLEVRGNVFLNATGPWADIVVQLTRTTDPDRTVTRSKGIQLITRPLPARMAFPIESREKDVTAVIRRGGRSYFITPWREYSMIGTTDTLYKGSPDDFAITEADVVEFLNEINTLYPTGLSREDVLFWVGGLRPLGDEDTRPEHAPVAHKAQIRDHAREGGPQNLVTVVGVKYTVCRYVAERTIDLVARKLGPRGRCITADLPLEGGDIEDFAAFAAEMERRMPGAVGRRLAFLYGTNAERILALGREAPDLLERVAESDAVLRAEVAYAVREEMAVRLADVVLRRTDLGSAGHPGRAALEECAGLMAKELGWTKERTQSEIAEVEKSFQPRRA